MLYGNPFWGTRCGHGLGASSINASFLYGLETLRSRPLVKCNVLLYLFAVVGNVAVVVVVVVVFSLYSCKGKLTVTLMPYPLSAPLLLHLTCPFCVVGLRYPGIMLCMDRIWCKSSKTNMS